MSKKKIRRQTKYRIAIQEFSDVTDQPFDFRNITIVSSVGIDELHSELIDFLTDTIVDD